MGVQQSGTSYEKYWDHIFWKKYSVVERIITNNYNEINNLLLLIIITHYLEPFGKVYTLKWVWK